MKDSKVTVIDNLVWPAMRYALGRKTYVTESVCSSIKALERDISNDTKRKMISDIQEAIKSGNAGMECDVKEWESLIAFLEKPYAK